uniref:Uncharacterized protein n=1 Tax=Anopheles epiroticus TaxID=199890 RepID=A0A182PP93_9DIPT
MSILSQMKHLPLQTKPLSRPFWGWVNMMFNRVDRSRLKKELDGTDSGIMHIGFEHLEGLSRLRKVVLHNCVYIDDQALWKLRYVAHTLEEVQISKCGNVTDHGLLQLKQLSHLQQVKTFELSDVKNMEEVEKKLKQALPNCKFDMKP